MPRPRKTPPTPDVESEDDPPAVTLYGMARHPRGFSVVRAVVSGARVLETEILTGDEPVPRGHAENVLRVAIAREVILPRDVP